MRMGLQKLSNGKLGGGNGNGNIQKRCSDV
jgi:hypothetical protein